MKEGIILLGHGSRHPDANEEVCEITRQVSSAAGEVLCETCFLQFGQPNLSQAVENLIGQGVEKITVIPLLLVMGSHGKVDLPEMLAEERRLHPQLKLLLAPHLGADPRITEIVLDRMKQGSEI